MWKRLRLIEREQSQLLEQVRDAFNKGNSAHVGLSRHRAEHQETVPSAPMEAALEPRVAGPTRTLKAGTSMRRYKQNGQTEIAPQR